MATAPAETKAPPAAKEALVPPDERFWKRYSPHHEFPLSTTGAVALHGIVIGLLLFFWLNSSDDVDKPPTMQLVEIDGAFGNLDGLGLGDTPYKPGASGKRTEDVGNPGANPTQIVKGPTVQIPDKLKNEAIKLEGKDDDDDPTDKALGDLVRVAREAEDSILAATNPTAPPQRPRKGGGGIGDGPKQGGTGGPLGTKGKGMKGKGGGAGDRPYGQILTTQMQRAGRWTILTSGDGHTHLAQLKALKVTLAIETPSPKVFRVFDLANDDLTGKLTELLTDQRDKVWYTNYRHKHPRSVEDLARVLGLRETPRCFVIFLPKALEDRMVVLEHEYRGRSEAEILETEWLVPQLPNGRYASEPKVVKQILRSGR